MTFDAAVAQALLEPFPAAEIKTKPGAGGKSLAFIDARDVHQRLDSVVCPPNWEFDYEVVVINPTRVQVKGCLTILGVRKCDAGEAIGKENEELLKAAVSDAMKRCAALFGVGRHLYELGPTGSTVTQAQVDASARKAGYKAEAPVLKQAAVETPEPYLCAVCEKAGVRKIVEDGKAQASLKLSGQVLCGPHGRDWVETHGAAQKARVPTGEVVAA